jgi:hypothetical protein
MGTHLHRLQAARLKHWLEKYSRGELWLMGEIGGTRWYLRAACMSKVDAKAARQKCRTRGFSTLFARYRPHSTKPESQVANRCRWSAAAAFENFLLALDTHLEAFNVLLLTGT